MKTQKGITLIALIITIIVMLILVGVSVSVALNTGLFKTAQGAAKNTEGARINETAISNGTINIEGVGETNINDYVQGLNDKSQGYTHKLVLPDFECYIKADTTFADLIAEYDEFTEAIGEFSDYDANVQDLTGQGYVAFNNKLLGKAYYYEELRDGMEDPLYNEQTSSYVKKTDKVVSLEISGTFVEEITGGTNTTERGVFLSETILSESEGSPNSDLGLFAL